MTVCPFARVLIRVSLSCAKCTSSDIQTMGGRAQQGRGNRLSHGRWRDAHTSHVGVLVVWLFVFSLCHRLSDILLKLFEIYGFWGPHGGGTPVLRIDVHSK